MARRGQPRSRAPLGSSLGQRPGRQTHAEAALALPAVIDELPASLHERFPDRADELHTRVTAFTEQVLDQLNRRPSRDTLVVHGDLMPWNVLTAKGATSGVLDFEKSHVDVPSNDVAFATWGGRYEADVVAGYASESGQKCTRDELRLQWAATCLSSLRHHLYQRKLGNKVGGLGWSLSHVLQEWPS